MNKTPTELLRPLALSELKPECSSPRESAVIRLRGVDMVHVTQDCTNKNAQFTVTISLTEASSSPTARLSASSGGSTGEITVTKRLEDFDALRTKVYSLAGTAHKGGTCSFCKRALHCALWSGSQYFHRNAAALSGLRDDKLLAALEAILTGLVALCSGQTESECPRLACRCQQQLPVAVQAFLLSGNRHHM